MAALFDAASSSTATTSATFSWSHTCSGGNRVLVVFVGQISATARTATSITYNGVAMHEWYDAADSGSSIGMAAYYLEGPASGSHTIAVTMSGVASSAFIGGAVSLKGVDQASITTGTATGHLVTGFSNTTTESITPDVNNAMIVSACLMSSTGVPVTTNASINQRVAWDNTNPNLEISTFTQTPAGLATIDWDSSSFGSRFWAQATIGFIPVEINLSKASYTLTLRSAGITSARKAGLGKSDYVLTEYGVQLRPISVMVNRAGHTASLTNGTKHTGSLTNQARSTASLTNQE